MNKNVKIKEKKPMKYVDKKGGYCLNYSRRK